MRSTILPDGSIESDPYAGPAATFSEASEDFERMLKRGIDFMSYLSMWGGSGYFTEEMIAKFTQQDKLGIARAMAISLDINSGDP